MLNYNVFIVSDGFKVATIKPPFSWNILKKSDFSKFLQGPVHHSKTDAKSGWPRVDGCGCLKPHLESRVYPLAI
jgi:hypothetical protein